MEFDGTVTIHAPREKVWQFLTSPEFVSQCAPGVQSVEVLVPDKQFRTVATIGLGSARVTFQADVEWLEMQVNEYARMKAHGKAPGSGVDVVSEMRLTSREDDTELNWYAEIKVVGVIASTAARLMGGVTRNMTNAFFECVKSKIEA